MWPAAASIKTLPRPVRRVVVFYALGTLGLWAVPLFNLLHAESSAVVAFAAFFAAGLSSLTLFAGGMTVARVLAWQEAALLVPGLLLTATLPVVPNCGYGQGLVFYLLFPVASVVLAVAGAFVLVQARVRFRRSVFVLAGLAVAMGGVIYDLGLHPQFFTYNHVFGGVLGPIYDEELVIRPGLFVFRGMTLLWAAGLFLVGSRLRGDETSLRARAALLAVTLLLGAGYLFADRLGVNTTHARLQRVLGSHLATTHFDIYFDPTALDAAAVRRLADDHEYRYQQLAAALDTEVDTRIRSYLYPDAETKARLTGARRTNVAPVWLPRPQTHVLLDAYPAVFPHELVHVFSREFGLPVVNASTAVGLVEGLAVALEPPDGLPTPHEQVSVAVALRRRAGEPSALAEDLARRLSPLGFWTGRGAVSYTTMGSFVRYLFDAYGPAPLKAAYATASFQDAYGKPVGVLAAEWAAYLARLPAVDRAAGALTQQRFGVLSLFEKPCPHYLPRYVRFYRRGATALNEADSSAALEAFEASLARQPAFAPALAGWARLRLPTHPADVVAQLDTLEERPPALDVLLGDALAVQGRAEEAAARYDAARRHLPAYAHEQAALVVLRKRLASYPEIVRILAGSGPPEARAAALAAYPAPPAEAAVLEALLWAEAGRYAEAASRLETTAPLPAIHRPRLGWQAQLAYRAGNPARAAARADEAAHAYRRAGAMNPAARWSAFAAKMRHLGQVVAVWPAGFGDAAPVGGTESRNGVISTTDF